MIEINTFNSLVNSIIDNSNKKEHKIGLSFIYRIDEANF